MPIKLNTFISITWFCFTAVFPLFISCFRSYFVWKHLGNDFFKFQLLNLCTFQSTNPRVVDLGGFVGFLCFVVKFFCWPVHTHSHTQMTLRATVPLIQASVTCDPLQCSRRNRLNVSFRYIRFPFFVSRRNRSCRGTEVATMPADSTRSSALLWILCVTSVLYGLTVF